ncbi:MAG: carboxypeptidase-like regulatory domain-containing protein, partial [Flavobacteriales bacterium]
MKNNYLLLFCILLSPIFVFAQQFVVKGKVTDSDGQPIPFVSVFIKGTTKGVSANVDGVYSINVERGMVTLSYTVVGFKTATQTVDVFDNITVNKTLQTEHYTLNSVVIKAGGEDPAYNIVRNAIKNRKGYLEEIFAYSSDVYIKGMQKLVGAPKKFFGRDIQKTLNLDTNRNGILYLSESQSKFSYMKPDRIKEEMISSKISGRNNAFSFNKASDMRINFYE